MKTLRAVVALVLFSGSTLAVEPPSWINLGNLRTATHVQDIIELPSGRLVAAGMSRDLNQNRHAVWTSTDAGLSWSQRLTGSQTGESMYQLQRDSYGRVWVVGTEEGAQSLAYSADEGWNWTWVAGPPANPAPSGYTIQIAGDYLYYGGAVGSPYSIALYRLNTVSLEWEMVVHYPQCDAITRMIFHNGQLLVFCRDKDIDAVHVFTHNPSDLDGSTRKLGRADVIPAAVPLLGRE